MVFVKAKVIGTEVVGNDKNNIALGLAFAQKQQKSDKNSDFFQNLVVWRLKEKLNLANFIDLSNKNLYNLQNGVTNSRVLLFVTPL